MNLSIATKHKQRMYALIDSAKTAVTIRTPAARAVSTNAVEKVFGATGATEVDYGTPITVDAWVHNGSVPGDFTHDPMEKGAAALGVIAKSDLVLSVKLEDVLVDSDKPYGRTYFDTAKDVQVSGSTFKITGVFRSGFAPLGPYILWVGLVNAGE